MILAVLLISIIIILAANIFKDVIKHKTSIKDENGGWIYYAVCGFLVFFAAAFGISDAALNTLCLRSKQRVSIKNLPGTITVGAMLPMEAVSLSYLAAVDVDIMTVLVLAATMAAGSRFGANVIGKSSPQTIKKLLLFALSLSVIILLVKIIFFSNGVGVRNGLEILPLIMVSFITFFIAALAMVGLASSAPMVAIFMLLGISPIASLATAIMANSLGNPMGAMKYIKDGTYNRKPVLMMLCGIPGGIIGSKCVQYVNPAILPFIMIGVIIFAIVLVLRDKAY